MTHEKKSFFSLVEKSRCLMMVLLCMIISSVAYTGYAQDRNVKGSIVDETGEPVIGATVVVKGTSNGTITDLDGMFTLSVNDGDELNISYVGYSDVAIKVDGRSEVHVILKEDTQLLDEVVVVGYGSMKKSDVTGAMVRVGEKEMKAMPVQNALQAMQGKAAGVDITSNERPGEVGTIRIRGERSLNAENGPLYVVDGIPMQGVGIENINPSDIASVDILKDASATAIYGSRGANGVVLVTTKRGTVGKVNVNYSGTLSIERMYDRMEMMNGGEWIDFARASKMYQGLYGADIASQVQDEYWWGKDRTAWANFNKGWANGTWDGSLVDTYDWTSHGLQTALSHEHTVSASGGTDKMQAYVSFGYLNQDGTQPGQKYQRYTAKTSVDLSPTEWLKLGATMNVTFGDQEYGYNYRLSATGAGNFYFALQGMLPWAVPYDENGNKITNPGGNDRIINPIEENSLTRNNRQNVRAFGSFYTELNLGKMFSPLEGLRYRLQFGPDIRYGRTGIMDAAESINGATNNIAQYNHETKRSWTLDNLLYYDKTLNEHTLGLTLLQSASAYYMESNANKAFVESSRELWHNLGSNGNPQDMTSNMIETQLQSYMIRANYGFRDRYLLTLSGRWDGASQLADGHKWDFFPSAALGWRVDQESFMQPYEWVNQLKLRFGVGTTGNSAIDAYATRGALASVFYHFGDQSYLGQIASDPDANPVVVMANPDLGWEKTTQYNLGVDFSFLNQRINGTIDVYKSFTKDLLMKQSIPSLTGYTSTWANVGKTENKGIDISLNTVNVRTRDFSWESTLTISVDRNKITALANGRTEDVNNSWWVGEQIGVYYDYVYDGIWKTSEADKAAEYGSLPGQIRVVDVNDDGAIDGNYDRQIVGYKRPKWSGGFQNTFNYKNWDFSLFFYGRFKFTVATGAETLSGIYAQRKVDYWVAGVNEDAKYYAPGSGGDNGDPYRTTMNYQDGSFIKLRNISLGYNFPRKMLAPTGISNLKLYLQCMNPGLIYSKIDWIDPDLGGSTFNRSLVFGINIGF